MWLADGDHAVIRTELTFHDGRTNTDASIAVDFARQLAIGLWAPAKMVEVYTRSTGDVDERVACTAVYSNFGRFVTAGRILPQM